MVNKFIMNISKSGIFTIFIIFLVFSSSSVFAAGWFSDKNIIWKANKNVFFKYTNQGKTSLGKNDHPVNLNSNEITTVLGSIKIRGDKLEAVFTDKQTNMLGQYLAKGFKNAKPGQDIIFVMEKKASKLFKGLKSSGLFVAGRAFYKDDQLNIIIGDYNRGRDIGFERAYDPTNTGIVLYKFDHGRRIKKSKGFTKTTVKIDGIDNKQINNIRRNDWLVIDVNKAKQARNNDKNLRKQEEIARKREELKEILGSEKIILSTEPTSPRKAANPLGKRLTILNQLKDQGLITDAEYATKRKQILDEL